MYTYNWPTVVDIFTITSLFFRLVSILCYQLVTSHWSVSCFQQSIDACQRTSLIQCTSQAPRLIHVYRFI